MTPASEYKLDVDQAQALAGLAVMATSDRLSYIKKLRRQRGMNWVLDLFTQAIGTANSVIENSREMAEFVAITQGDLHPHQAEHINMPTLLGAALGATNAADSDQATICEGCAFRLGSVANQCTPTQADVQHVELHNDRFLCHMNGLDDKGNPTRTCPGWAKYQKGQANGGL